MLSRIHNKLGTAGLVVAIVALVAALAGAAFAAGGLTKQQEKQVKKIAKQFAGKQGPQGPAGTPGKDGANGANGTNGAKGATGPKGATGKEGKKGATGATGEINTEGSLPSGKSEFGHWSIGTTTEEQQINGANVENWLTSISFAVPIPYEKEEAGPFPVTPKLKYVPVGEEEVEGCPGTALAPTAEPGFLCIYERSSTAPAPSIRLVSSAVTLDSYGITLFFVPQENEAEPGTNFPTYTTGTWAVTAP
jgi:hypothetical protein